MKFRGARPNAARQGEEHARRWLHVKKKKSALLLFFTMINSLEGGGARPEAAPQGHARRRLLGGGARPEAAPRGKGCTSGLGHVSSKRKKKEKHIGKRETKNDYPPTNL